MYGHINNTVYYSYFDTIINHFLINKGNLNPVESKVIGLCVESKCNYFSPLEYPCIVEAGLMISHKGTSSIKYEIGIFKEGCSDPSAYGHFVHVFVDEATRASVPFPQDIKNAVDFLISKKNAVDGEI